LQNDLFNNTILYNIRWYSLRVLHLFTPLIPLPFYYICYTIFLLMSKFYTIEEGKVLLNKTKWFQQREIAQLDETTRETVLETLNLKFEDILKEWEEFKKLLAEEKEITRLAGKLSRKKSYFSKAKAIGDYDKIYEEIVEAEKKIEERVNEVIKIKTELCEKLATLIASDPSADGGLGWKDATAQMTAIRKEFGDLPQVPHPEDENLKKKLEELINDFFIKKSEHHKEFEKDLMVNLSKKLELCERAEGIKESEDWRKTTETYGQLFELWKAVGPVPRHKSEELWMRYNAAKDYFYARKQKFYDELIENLESNLRDKEAIITQAEAIKESTDWNKTSEKMNELMDAWKKTGGVGKDKSDEVWNRFNEARNHFFTNKKNHFAKRKVELDDNLAKRVAIAQRAEELKETKDFEQGTKEFSELMEEWKAIGYAPRKQANEQWEIFIKAKKQFFERKDAVRDAERVDIMADLNDKIGKSIGFINKLKKELDTEQDVLNDAKKRLENIAPSANAFETEERYSKIVKEAEENVAKVQEKIDGVQAKIDVDKKERGRLFYHQKRAEERNPELIKEREAKEAARKEEWEKRRKENKARGGGNRRSSGSNSSNNKPSETLLGAQLKGLNFDGLED